MPQTFAEEKLPLILHKQRNGSSLTTCTHTHTHFRQSPFAITSLHRIHYWFSIRLRFIHSFCAFGAQPIHVCRPVRQLTLLLNPSLAMPFVMCVCSRAFGILFLIEPLLLLMPFRVCASNNVSIGSTSIPATVVCEFFSICVIMSIDSRQPQLPSRCQWFPVASLCVFCFVLYSVWLARSCSNHDQLAIQCGVYNCLIWIVNSKSSDAASCTLYNESHASVPKSVMQAKCGFCS